MLNSAQDADDLSDRWGHHGCRCNTRVQVPAQAGKLSSIERIGLTLALHAGCSRCQAPEAVLDQKEWRDCVGIRSYTTAPLWIAPSMRATASAPPGVSSNSSGLRPPSPGCGFVSQCVSQRSTSSVAALGCVDARAIARAWSRSRANTGLAELSMLRLCANRRLCGIGAHPGSKATSTGWPLSWRAASRPQAMTSDDSGLASNIRDQFSMGQFYIGGDRPNPRAPCSRSRFQRLRRPWI